MEKKKHRSLWDNELVELKVDNIAFGGRGVGTLQSGQVCFVAGALPGERVRVRITKEKANHNIARLVEIIKPSPKRQETNCPYAVAPEGLGMTRAVTCPGCSYQHLTYEFELETKQKQLLELIERIAFLDLNDVIQPPVGSPKQFNYRNKITLNTQLDNGEMHLGYLREDNVTVLDIESCPLADEAINNKLQEALATPGFKHTLHDPMRVTLRKASKSDVLLWRNNPPKGSSWLKEETCIGSISVPIGSFFQVNIEVANLLIQRVQELLKDISPENIIDLYCGTGIFSLAAAEIGITDIIGLDVDKDTIQAANYNAKQRGLSDKTFMAGNSEKFTKSILEEHGTSRTTLIVDPTRSGLGIKTKQAICNSAIDSIIYISCGPDTLARDLKFFAKRNFEVQTIQLFDMFPKTAHFETLVYLERDSEQ